MKLSRFAALAILLISSSAGPALAQPSSVATLREEITHLERVVADSNTPLAMTVSARRLVAIKRGQLISSLGMQLDALRKYHDSYSARFSLRESRSVRAAISALESELLQLKDSTSSSSAFRTSVIERGHADKGARRLTVRNGPSETSVRSIRQRKPASSIAPRSSSPTDTPTQAGIRRSFNDALLSASGASSSTLPLDCTICELPDKVFVVDASTGKAYWHDTTATPVNNENKTRFNKGERVRVIVINKNPFLFKYNITIQETTVTEDALIPFLKVFSPIFANVAAAAEDVFSLPDMAIPTESCPPDKRRNAELAYDALKNDIHNLNLQIEQVVTRSPTSDLNVLKRAYAPVSTEYNNALTTFSRSKAPAETTLCVALCTTADHLQATLTGYNPEPDFKVFQTSVENLKAQADAINGKINEFVSSYPECQPLNNGFSVLRDVQRKIQRFSAHTVSGVLNELNQMREGNKEFVKMRDNLNALSSRPDLLQEQRTIGPYNDPTNVTVRVEFKGLSSPDTEAFKPIADAKLNFGGDKRFALSGGVAYGLLDRPEYKAILGFERDQQGNLIGGQTVPASVIGVTDTSKKRIGPVLMLNTRLTNYRDTNLFFSVGINGTTDNTGLNIDYLIGPSINVLDRKVFLTYGLYGGRVQRLNEGLFLGLKVPDSTSGEKLVRKDFVWKSGFAVTYKIK